MSTSMSLVSQIKSAIFRSFPGRLKTTRQKRYEHFLEHVQNYERTIQEMHCILKPNGKLRFCVPHFRNACTPWHLHKWDFRVFTCKPIPYLWDGKQLVATESIRIRYTFVGVIPGCFWAILEFFANIHPESWNYFGFLIDEVEYVGRKLSDTPAK